MLTRLASLFGPFLRRVPGAMIAARALRRHVDPRYRALQLVRRDRARGAMQPYPDTGDDRYPELFDALAVRLAHLEQPRILSFGCSTGQEVQAMRRRLPNARITGLEANPHSLRIARKRDRHPLSDYRIGTAPDAGDAFDGILALAVCRHGDLEAQLPQVCTNILSFCEFAAAMEKLDRVLAISGWLAIWHAHFRFRDLPFAARYEIDPLRLHGWPAQQPLYGPDDCLMAGVTEDAVLFRKLASAPG